MDHTFFHNSFRFRLLSFQSDRHTDNSAGIEYHFIGRMRHGSGLIRTLDGEELSLSVGDLFYLPLGLRYHSYWSVSEDTEPLLAWDSYGFQFFPSPTEARYRMQKITADDETAALLDQLRELPTVSPTSVGLLYLFLGRVLPTMSEAHPNAHAALLNKAGAYITEHPDLKIADLARFCNMSESALYAFFRQHADCTPIELKNRILAEKAIPLLTSTDLSIEEISRTLNFCSSAYFRKIFKQQIGKAPTAFRKERSLKDTV